MKTTTEKPEMSTTSAPTTTAANEEPVWRQAGAAWGHAATDWAYLFEPYARDAIEHLFRELGIDSSTGLVDIACGSGYALARADRLGATSAGIDASEDLIDIARNRAPKADLVAGDMFDLPWADARFTVATSFNGIWGGCTDALREAHRVLTDGGRIGLTFWGAGANLDLRDWFIALGTSTPSVGEEMISLADVATPGVVEEMLQDAGFTDIVRTSVPAVMEFADESIAWRAFRSPGLVVPALDAIGEAELKQRLMAAVEPFRASDGSYRFVNELVCVTATAR